MNTKSIFLIILLASIYTCNIVTSKNGKEAVSNVLGKNILQLNQGSQEASTKTKQDLYLKEEGVTNLAYDDFLETQFIQNIEYAGAGYRLPYGNPRPSSEIDPGYTSYKAFAFEYQSDKLHALSGDADYFIPDGFLMNSKTSCEISYSSEQISSQKEYSQSLQVSASVDGGWGSFAFQASADYNQSSKELANEDSMFIESSANCNVYSIEVNRYLPPNWSVSLINAFKSLLKNNNQNNYFNFFENFGSHVTVGVEMGSLFRYRFNMKKKEVTKMKSMGLDVSVGVQAWSVSGSASTSYQKDSKEAFSNAMTNWSQFSIGAPPNADNNALEWASQAASSPMPIKGSFASWSQFLVKYVPKNQGGFTDQELNSLKSGFQNAYKNYCGQYLLPNKIVQSCDGSFKAQASSNNKPIAPSFTCSRRAEINDRVSSVDSSSSHSSTSNRSPLSKSINTHWKGTCWHANQATNRNYYTVTLDKPYYVNEIKLYGRTDCCQDRLQYIDIQFDGKTCYSYNSNPKNNVISTGGYCKGMVQQITVKYNNRRNSQNAYMTICGLQIFNCLN